MTQYVQPTFTSPPRKLDRHMLPVPFIDGRDSWIKTHDMAWRIAFDHIGHHEGLQSPWFMDEACMPDRLWQWDTCFMVLYTCYAPAVFPGIQSLDNFYSWQREDGFIAMCTLFESGEPAYGERINPPLFAWVEWEYYRLTGDNSRFEWVLPILVKYFDWIKANRRRPAVIRPHIELTPSESTDNEGLYWATCAGAMGMDNSPRAVHLSWQGGDICWIDLSSQQALAAMYLARIAAFVGDHVTETRFNVEYRDLSTQINELMWCKRSQFYHDIFLDGNFLSAKTVASFWPMLARFASTSQAEALLAHLRNPNEFWRPHPVPSLSYDDPNYVESGGYWVGGVWAPTNYMIVRGLLEYGFDATAHEIAVKHLEGMDRVAQTYEPHTIWEAYAPEGAAPSSNKTLTDLSRPHFCGWSALGATSMLYENIIGVRSDTPARKITWDIRLAERHGFERYPFLGGELQLTCAEAVPGELHGRSKREVSIVTPVEFEIDVRSNGRQIVRLLPPGTHSLEV